MSDEKYLEVLSSLKALEFITRSFVAGHFSTSQNPRDEASRFFESLIASLARSDGQHDEAMRRFYDMMEDDIRLFANAVDGRLQELERGKG